MAKTGFCMICPAVMTVVAVCAFIVSSSFNGLRSARAGKLHAALRAISAVELREANTPKNDCGMVSNDRSSNFYSSRSSVIATLLSLVVLSISSSGDLLRDLRWHKVVLERELQAHLDATCIVPLGLGDIHSKGGRGRIDHDILRVEERVIEGVDELRAEL